MELLRDLCQQQPGAGNASSESHEYGQDQDIEAGVESEDQEKAGDQEQDRSDGVRRYRVENQRNGVRGGAAWTRVDFGTSIQNQQAASGDDGERNEFGPQDPERLIGDVKEDRDEQHGYEQCKCLRGAVSELLRLRDDADPNRDRDEQQPGEAGCSAASNRRECAPVLQAAIPRSNPRRRDAGHVTG